MEVLGSDEALDGHGKESSAKAGFVELRYYAGLEHEEIAELLGISRSPSNLTGVMRAPGCLGGCRAASVALAVIRTRSSLANRNSRTRDTRLPGMTHQTMSTDPYHFPPRRRSHEFKKILQTTKSQNAAAL